MTKTTQHRKRRTATGLLMLMTAAVLAAQADGATIHVEKDGSGDFTVLQDAIDASSPGDTILIGPGRYDDFREFWFSGGYSVQTLAGIAHTLTLQGVDRESVIIGPSTPAGTVDDQTHALSVDTGVTGVIVEDLTFENTWDLIWVDTAISVRRCTLRNASRQAIEFSNADGMIIDECLIEDNIGSSAVFSPAGLGNRNFTIANSTFRNNEVGLELASIENAVISGCSFDGQVVAAQFWAHSTVFVSNCEFQNSTGVHLASKDTSVTEVVDCVFGPVAQGGVFVTDCSTVSGHGNDVAGGAFATLHLQGPEARLILNDCDIGNTGGWSVYAATYETNIDLRNNYWGTPDPSQIEAWIYDRQEDPTLGNVLFDPFSEQPVPAQAESIGGVKARFAPDR